MPEEILVEVPERLQLIVALLDEPPVLVQREGAIYRINGHESFDLLTLDHPKVKIS